ncbi:MAG: NAD(P)/FAD-dependent oxidoreductase, partial [Alphaproteobacteria bacterium]
MTTEPVLAPGFKTTPYWWLDAPPRELPDSAVPAETDVAIVGSGYTGLSAALTLARAGRRVHVLEAEHPGFGASTRNSGFVGRELRLKFSVLARRYGIERAAALAREAVAANTYVVELIRGEQIRCHYVACGRFVAAATPAHYEALARELALARRHVGLDGEMVARPEQHREIGSDLYHGGMVLA